MNKRFLMAGGSFLALLVLIFDTKTALQGANDGIALCIATVIPALFPFFVVSILLTSLLSGFSIPFLGLLWGLPKGTESLLLIGLLGGYPAGAQAICQSWKNGCLNKRDARIMLGFGCNAGPSFLFGIGSQLFENPWIPWAVWIIHIFAAYLTSRFLPKRSAGSCSSLTARHISLATAMKQAVRTLGEVCGWVVLFRMVIGFCERWFLFLFHGTVQVVLSGFLELSNGCISLNGLESPGLRFLLFTVFLAVGGLCVGMQTVSVTDGLGTGLYFPGKCLQAGFSFLLAYLLQYFLFTGKERFESILCVAAAAVCIIVNFALVREKKSSIPEAVPV